MPTSQRRGFLAAVALATVLVVAGAPTARAKPAIEVSGGLTQPVFSYRDAIREHVRVQSPVDSDGDGKKDLVRVDIIRPKETNSGLKVPVIMHESPYYDFPGVGFELDHKQYDADGNLTKFPLFYDNYFGPRGYAFVSVDMIGTRLSDGCPTSGGPSDVLGGKAVIDWLNGRATAYDPKGAPVRATWTTGRTGMIGHSGEGARERHPHRYQGRAGVAGPMGRRGSGREMRGGAPAHARGRGRRHRQPQRLLARTRLPDRAGVERAQRARQCLPGGGNAGPECAGRPVLHVVGRAAP